MSRTADEAHEWPELICVLCGLIVVFDDDGSVETYPSRCAANGGGQHIHPSSPAAAVAKELHAAWLRNPHASPGAS